MALDMSKLKQVQADLDSRNGDKLFMTTKALVVGENDFRIAPPKPNLAGSYFLEVITWWINCNGKKTKLVDFETFGESSVVMEEIEAARATGDADLIALCDDADKLSRKAEFWLPGWYLKLDDSNNYTIVDDICKIFQCGSGLLKDINRIVTSRSVVNGTENGIADRVKGRNLIITKSGSGMNTEYKVFPTDVYEMPEKYYSDDKIPDVVQLAEKELYTEAYQRGVIRNYLYGEPMPERPKVSAPSTPAAQPAAKAIETKTVAAPATKAVGRGAAAPAKRTVARPAAPVAEPEPEADYAEESDVAADQAETVAPPPVTTRRAPAAPPAGRKPAAPAGRTAAASGAAPAAGRRSLIDDTAGLDD